MCKRVLLKNWKIQSLCFYVARFSFLSTVHDFSRRTAKNGVFSVATKSVAKILLLLPCWEKMSPLKCLLTLTSPPSTLSGGTRMVVVTSRINILTSVITVIATFSVCSISHGACHKQRTQVREMSTACCDKSSVTLETNPISVPWQIRTCCRCGGVSRTGRLGSEWERKTEAPNPQVVRWPQAHSLTLGGEASSLKGSSQLKTDKWWTWQMIYSKLYICT